MLSLLLEEVRCCEVSDYPAWGGEGSLLGGTLGPRAGSLIVSKREVLFCNKEDSVEQRREAHDLGVGLLQ